MPLNFFNSLSQFVGFYSIAYEKQVIIGDFNLTPDNKSMRQFIWIYVTWSVWLN